MLSESHHQPSLLAVRSVSIPRDNDGEHGVVGTRFERLELLSQLVECFVAATDTFAALTSIGVIGSEPLCDCGWGLVGRVEEIGVLLKEVGNRVSAGVFIPFTLCDEGFGCRGW